MEQKKKIGKQGLPFQISLIAYLKQRGIGFSLVYFKKQPAPWFICYVLTVRAFGLGEPLWEILEAVDVLEIVKDFFGKEHFTWDEDHDVLGTGEAMSAR